MSNVNNPFRNEPSKKVHNNVEEWGKSKFKPTKFSGGIKKRSNLSQGNNFNKKEIFNEVAKDAKPENSTPWNKYKDEIVFKQREEEQAVLQANMESSEAKAVLKQREINYRKSIVEQQKQEPTEWENFADECVEHKNNFNSMKAENSYSKKFCNTQSNKNTSKCEEKSERSKRFSKEILQNFQSNKLTYHQKDGLRGAITQVSMLTKGGTLRSLVKSMKRKNKRRAQRKNLNKTKI